VVQGRDHYQLPVKAFADSNDTGIGDFSGMTQRLEISAGARGHRDVADDVLSEPGATTVRTSRLRRINPDSGTMRDFRRFMAEASSAA